MSRSKRRFKTSRLKKTLLFRCVVIPLCSVCFIACSWVLQKLPPRGIYGCGRSVGLLLWLLSSKRRKITLRNLEIAFGDQYTLAERRGIARQSMQHFCITALEVFLMPRYGGATWQTLVSMTPEQRAILATLREHRGPVAVHTGHFGSWEFCTGVSSYCARPMAVVYRPLELDIADARIGQLRSSQGVRVYAKKGALKGYLQTLKNNEWLGVTADQNAGTSTAFIDFFGVPAATELSYFQLYLRFETMVAAIFLARDGFRFQFHLAGLDIFTINRDADPDAESRRFGQWYMDCLEKAVRAHPEQYNWMHRRWRSRPQDAAPMYKDLDRPLATAAQVATASEAAR